MTPPPRVGIVGYAHEVNAFAAPITVGHGIDASRTPGGLAATWEAGALVARLHELSPGIEVVELPVWEFGASGPLLGDDFRSVVSDVVAAIEAAGPLDAIAVLGHGAGRTTDDLDPDATFLAAVARAAGPTVPIVTVLDFHANLSPAMCDHCDAIVGYRTNPHVDIGDRLVEAADHVVRLLGGAPTTIAWCRLPMVLPQIAQLTASHEPLGMVVDRGQQLVQGPIRNVSVFGGFSLSDVVDCGVSVCVTADAGHGVEAAAVVGELTRLAWALRDRYRLHAVPVAAAVEHAARASHGERSPVILADVADNPGGGAPGNTTFVLAALQAAGVRDVVMGLQCDPGVVAAAWQAGAGSSFTAQFNEGSTDPLAPPFTAEAAVLALVDAPLVPTRGVYAGSTRHPGRSCALDLGGIRIGVSSHKVQCADDDTLRHVHLEPAHARVVVVKSRGHFRAGFDHLFADDQIIEVGAPGVATPELDTVAWQHLPRPVWPLDEFDGWQPVVQLHRRGAA